jgi:hypothetical protein
VTIPLLSLQVCSADQDYIPATKQFVKRVACGDRHPGLCFERDAAVYTQTLVFAKNLERLFSTVNLLRGFVRFQSANASIPLTVVAYLAGTRARRLYAPQVLVFATCELADTVKFDTTPQHHYNFVSVWSLGMSWW